MWGQTTSGEGVNRKRRKGSARRDNRDKESRFTLGNGTTGITAEALLTHVRSTTPYWIHIKGTEPSVSSSSSLSHNAMFVELSRGSMGWLHILNSPCSLQAPEYASEAERIDYFALCLAAHFATVASYVPSDVDSKIRGHCWEDPSEDVLESQLLIFKNALEWDISKVSNKVIQVYDDNKSRPELISGHHGELLGVLCGAWGAFLRKGNMKRANFIETLIQTELDREAKLFRQLRLRESNLENDTLLLKLSAILTHNVGDIDQGYSYWGQSIMKHISKHQLFSRLAHQRGERFGGEFIRAKALYKQFLSAEGHRNYPLREARCLRSTPEFLLPFGPWYESWGRLVATHPTLSEDDRVMVLRQLLRGCDSKSKAWCVPNQIGYYRALNGMSVISLDDLANKLPTDYIRILQSSHVIKHMDISEEAFASDLGCRARDFMQSLP